MTKRLTDIAITVSLVVLILQFMPIGAPHAHARDVKPDEVNKGTEVGGYDELWEAWKFVQPEGDDNLTGVGDSWLPVGPSKVQLRKGHYKNNDGDKWHDNRVRYHFLIASGQHNGGGVPWGAITAMPPVVSAWRVTGHIHGK